MLYGIQNPCNFDHVIFKCGGLCKLCTLSEKLLWYYMTVSSPVHDVDLLNFNGVFLAIAISWSSSSLGTWSPSCSVKILYNIVLVVQEISSGVNSGPSWSLTVQSMQYSPFVPLPAGYLPNLPLEFYVVLVVSACARWPLPMHCLKFN